MRKVALTFSLLFLVELVLGGPGFWTIGGGFSVRKYLFVFSLIALTMYAVQCGNWRFRFFDAAVLGFLAFSVTIWMFLLPSIRGQSLQSAFADSGALFLLLLYFPLSQLIRNGMIRWDRVKRVFLLLVVAVSFVQVLAWVLVAYDNDLAVPVRLAFIALFHSIGAGSEGLDIYVGYMPDGFYRVMWITSVYFLPAFCILFARPDKAAKDYSCMVILFLGIIVSYTRALWLGSAAWIVMSLVGTSLVSPEGKTGRLRPDRGTCLALAMFVGVLGAMWWSGGGTFVERLSFLSAGDEGTSVRLYQIRSLLDAWSNHPILGQGFGSHADYIRAENAPFSYEMVGFALLMKLGVAGIFFWIISAGFVFLHAFQVARRWRRYHWLIWWLSTSIAFFAVSLTNPYLLNFIGMSIVLLLVLEIDWEDRTNHDQVYGIHRNL